MENLSHRDLQKALWKKSLSRSQKLLETFQNVRQTVQNVWRRKPLQSLTVKNIENKKYYKVQLGKKSETFSLRNQTVEKYWKLYGLETKQ